MVMSEEAGEGGAKAGQQADPAGKPQARRVSEKEKELAGEASKAFSSGEYSLCLSALEKLEVLRPSDCTLAHNKIVSQCKSGGQVSLVEVVEQLEGLVKTLGLELNGPKTEEESEVSVLIYNLAVANFRLRNYIQASELASRLLPVCSDTQPLPFCIKVLVLNIELALALYQVSDARALLELLEGLLVRREAQGLSSLDSGGCQDTGGHGTGSESEPEHTPCPPHHSSVLLVLRARCQVLARDTRALKKELKSVVLPGTPGQTTEFIRAHIEALQSNHRKAIKVLNSCVQAASSQEDLRNKVFPHFYNSLGCLHMMMKKPNLAVYYFKNALDRIDSLGEGARLTQPQVLYNIGLSLLHARRPGIAFDILLEVLVGHYLDPVLWFHLAECCILASQPPGTQASIQGLGAGLSHKVVAASSPCPQAPLLSPPGGGGATLSLDFCQAALKNATSLLPAPPTGGPEAESVAEELCHPLSGSLVSSPLTWGEVQHLRVAVAAAQAYTALGLGDFLTAGVHANVLLSLVGSCTSGWGLLGHLYLAESLILADRVTEALEHLDPKFFTDTTFNNSNEFSSQTCYPASLGTEGLQTVEFNLAVALSLKGDFGKAAQLTDNIYKEGDCAVQVVLLVLYLSLQQGQVDKARRIVRERQCNPTSRPPE